MKKKIESHINNTVNNQQITYKHVAIEGLDGVGKTTAANILSKNIKWKFVEKPLCYLLDNKENIDSYLQIRDRVNLLTNDNILRAWFYGLGNIYTTKLVQDKNIITDRHIVSNYFWCGYDDTDKIFALLVELMGVPDYTIILQSSQEAIYNRLKERNHNDSDLHKIELYDIFYSKSIAFLEKYSMPYSIVDSTKLNKKEVADKIEEILRMKEIL